MVSAMTSLRTQPRSVSYRFNTVPVSCVEKNDTGVLVSAVSTAYIWRELIAPVCMVHLPKCGVEKPAMQVLGELGDYDQEKEP